MSANARWPGCRARYPRTCQQEEIETHPQSGPTHFVGHFPKSGRRALDRQPREIPRLPTAAPGTMFQEHPFTPQRPVKPTLAPGTRERFSCIPELGLDLMDSLDEPVWIRWGNIYPVRRIPALTLFGVRLMLKRPLKSSH